MKSRYSIFLIFLVIFSNSALWWCQAAENDDKDDNRMNSSTSLMARAEVEENNNDNDKNNNENNDATIAPNLEYTVGTKVAREFPDGEWYVGSITDHDVGMNTYEVIIDEGSCEFIEIYDAQSTELAEMVKAAKTYHAPFHASKAESLGLFMIFIILGVICVGGVISHRLGRHHHHRQQQQQHNPVDLILQEDETGDESEYKDSVELPQMD